MKIFNTEKIKLQAAAFCISEFILMKRAVNYRPTRKKSDCMCCQLRRNKEYSINGVKIQRIQCELIGFSRDLNADVKSGCVCDCYKYVDMNVNKE